MGDSESQLSNCFFFRWRILFNCCILSSYVTAFTMPATPRGGQGSAYFPGNMATNKSRSLRGGMVRNGSMLTPSGGKGGLLPGPVRTSSTLPRMSARQLQRPIPHNTTPSFLRPNSTINFSPGSPIQAPPPPPSSGQQQVIGQSFQPQQIHVSSHLTSSATHTASSSSSSPFAAAVGHPPPLPPRTCEISETYMDDLCKRVTDHVLPDGELLSQGGKMAARLSFCPYFSLLRSQ